MTFWLIAYGIAVVFFLALFIGAARGDEDLE